MNTRRSHEMTQFPAPTATRTRAALRDHRRRFAAAHRGRGMGGRRGVADDGGPSRALPRLAVHGHAGAAPVGGRRTGPHRAAVGDVPGWVIARVPPSPWVSGRPAGASKAPALSGSLPGALGEPGHLSE